MLEKEAPVETRLREEIEYSHFVRDSDNIKHRDESTNNTNNSDNSNKKENK